MNTIRAYVDFDERNNVHYWKDFTIIDELPEVGDWYRLGNIVTEIEPVNLDCDQGGRDEVSDYEYFRLKIVPKQEELDDDEDPEDWAEYEYVAVPYPELENEQEDNFTKEGE